MREIKHRQVMVVVGMSSENGSLSPEQLQLLGEKHYAFVTTLMSDGSPHSTLVWVDTDGEHVLFNTSRGRLKERNLLKDPRISVALFDPQDPYRGLVVRGRAELIDEGAVDHIHRLANKYMGSDYPWLQPGEQRITVKVVADRISGVR